MKSTIDCPRVTVLEGSLSRSFPGTPLQKCVTHLIRNMLAKVRHGGKGELAEDLGTFSESVTGVILLSLPEVHGRHYVQNGVRIITV